MHFLSYLAFSSKGAVGVELNGAMLLVVRGVLDLQHAAATGYTIADSTTLFS